MNISEEEFKKYLIEIIKNNKDADEEKLSEEIDNLFLNLITKSIEENVSEDDLPEELKQLVKEMFENSSSVDDVIKQRKQEIEINKESFIAVKKNYRVAAASRHINLTNLRLLRLSVKFYKLKLQFLQDEGYKLYEEYENRINGSIEEIYNLKSILKLIKIAINRLEKVEETLCLKEINELIYNIIQKQGLICDYVEDLAEKYSLRYEGINITSNNKLEQELNKTDENILNYIRILNLHE